MSEYDTLLPELIELLKNIITFLINNSLLNDNIIT